MIFRPYQYMPKDSIYKINVKNKCELWIDVHPDSATTHLRIAIAKLSRHRMTISKNTEIYELSMEPYLSEHARNYRAEPDRDRQDTKASPESLLNQIPST